MYSNVACVEIQNFHTTKIYLDLPRRRSFMVGFMKPTSQVLLEILKCVKTHVLLFEKSDLITRKI